MRLCAPPRAPVSGCGVGGARRGTDLAVGAASRQGAGVPRCGWWCRRRRWWQHSSPLYSLLVADNGVRRAAPDQSQSESVSTAGPMMGERWPVGDPGVAWATRRETSASVSVVRSCSAAASSAPTTDAALEPREWPRCSAPGRTLTQSASAADDGVCGASAAAALASTSSKPSQTELAAERGAEPARPVAIACAGAGDGASASSAAPVHDTATDRASPSAPT